MNYENLNYDLEIDKIINKIKDDCFKNILLQFPDGLKMYSKEIYEILIKEFPNKNIFIYFGDCYGACDIPIIKNVDLIIQFGHTKFVKEEW